MLEFVALPIEDRERNLTKSILARVCTLKCVWLFHTFTKCSVKSTYKYIIEARYFSFMRRHKFAQVS